MRTRISLRQNVTFLGPLLWLAAVAVVAAGCGGDSSGGYSGPGGGPGISTATIGGTVQSAAGVPVAGWTVGFDIASSSRFTATTSPAGRYSITVPWNVVTGQDKLTVLDTNQNLWYDGAITVNHGSVTQSVTLPAYDTVSGTITTSTGNPAANFEVRFVTADTSVNTGWFWDTYTSSTGAYTLNIPVSIVENSGTAPVVTGVDNVYVNSVTSQDTLEAWAAQSVAFSTTGGVSYTLNETLPVSPIFTQAANVKTASEPANRSLPLAKTSTAK